MSQKEAIAFHLGWDIADVEWYQPFIMSKKILACESAWYCATKSVRQPIVKNRDGITFGPWEIAESFQGWNVWAFQTKGQQ
jgi:hypothetical protein